MLRTRPHFYICGGSMDDRVVLYASDSLRRVEFDSEMELHYEYFTPEEFRTPPEYKYTFSAESHTMTKIIADNYPDAFSKLFGDFNPGASKSNLGIEGMRGIQG